MFLPRPVRVEDESTCKLVLLVFLYQVKLNFTYLFFNYYYITIIDIVF